MIIALATLALALQAPEDAAARRCDSQIPWMTDGIELIDMELAKGHHPQYPEAHQPKYDFDRAALIEKAMAAAAEKKRLILWYCPRVWGLHMYRAVLPDRYMKATAFSDPGVVDLINAKFVPLRMCCDEATGKRLGLKPFDFVEPGFVLLTPDGKVVHKLDHFRTFNADWFRAALVAVLRRNPEFNRPAGDGVRDLIRGGDDEAAFDRANDEEKATILRHAGKYEAVLRLPCSATQRGAALLALKRFAEARSILEGVSDPEAMYLQAAADVWTSRSPEAHLRALVAKYPDSPWAWRAAADLVRAEDSLPQGPLVHHFEDFFYRPQEGLPTSTRLPAPDVDTAVLRALDFLLRAQAEDGWWRDSRYAYWPDPKILPNVWMAVTAAAATALLEWRDLDPDRIDAALRKADPRLRDDTLLSADQHEEIYAHVFRLHYFAARKDVPMLNRIVARVVAMQDEQGFWAHEYPNPFITGVVVHALWTARSAGAEVPSTPFRHAAEALMSTRGSGGRQTYRCDGKPPDNEKSSMSRTPICELALYECGRLELKDVAAGVEAYWKYVDRLEAVRLCDYHSDGRLAGFFYFHAGFHTLEAARALDGPSRDSTAKRFRERLLAIPEWDGSYVDSHEIGKSYGTAMALLMFGRTR